jgi:gamma-glutamylcyclotransferase (GGCT)/AIG2-like uncharacterized protein YtfP
MSLKSLLEAAVGSPHPETCTSRFRTEEKRPRPASLRGVEEISHRVFSYGTLRQPEVQRALYGREVVTVPDELPGYRLEWLRITDPEVIATSGSDRHPILRRASEADCVAGAYLTLDENELAATDAYEVEDYTRREVLLESGVTAWVYVGA